MVRTPVVRAHRQDLVSVLQAGCPGTGAALVRVGLLGKARPRSARACAAWPVGGSHCDQTRFSALATRGRSGPNEPHSPTTSRGVFGRQGPTHQDLMMTDSPGSRANRLGCIRRCRRWPQQSLGVGKIGNPGGEPVRRWWRVVLAARDHSHAAALLNDLAQLRGPHR